MTFLKVGPLQLQEQQLEPRDDAVYVADVTNIHAATTIRVDWIHREYDLTHFNLWGVSLGEARLDSKVIKPKQTVRLKMGVRTGKLDDSGFPRDFTVKFRFDLSIPLPSETSQGFVMHVTKD